MTQGSNYNKVSYGEWFEPKCYVIESKAEQDRPGWCTPK